MSSEGKEIERFKATMMETVAETLFAKFSAEDLRSLVAEVLTKSLTSNNTFYGVQQQIEKMATEAMFELLKEDTIKIRIKTYVKDGIETAMEKIPGAVRGKVTDLALTSVSEAINRASSGRGY